MSNLEQVLVFSFAQVWTALIYKVACEDLKAFERRLTEIIASTTPTTLRWRLLLAVVSVCVAVGAVYWLQVLISVWYLVKSWNLWFFKTEYIYNYSPFIGPCHCLSVLPNLPLPPPLVLPLRPRHAPALPRWRAQARHRHLHPRLAHPRGPLRLQHGLRRQWKTHSQTEASSGISSWIKMEE